MKMNIFTGFLKINFIGNIWCKDKVEILEADMRCFYILFLHDLFVYVCVYFLSP